MKQNEKHRTYNTTLLYFFFDRHNFRPQGSKKRGLPKLRFNGIND